MAVEAVVTTSAVAVEVVRTVIIVAAIDRTGRVAAVRRNGMPVAVPAVHKAAAIGAVLRRWASIVVALARSVRKGLDRRDLDRTALDQVLGTVSVLVGRKVMLTSAPAWPGLNASSTC